MDIITILKPRCTGRRIVFPESQEDRILLAAWRAVQEGLCAPIFIGAQEDLARQCTALGIPTEGWFTSLLPENAPLNDYAEELTASGIDPTAARFLLEEPLFFGAMLVRLGQADAMVAGYVAESGEVINAATMFVGLEESITAPSSCFLFEIPGFQGSQGELLFYADCGLQIEPTVDELASTAILTARSARQLLNWEPRVALLSFSTKGSAEHPRTERLAQVLELIRTQEPELLVDGEMQADAALCPEVAAKKIPNGSPVAGRANILIFPSLEAGNIAYKLTQRLTGATAYGPILQGFRRPVCDLSRGSSVEDIIGVIAIASVM